jgi:hypothetical protein
LQPFVGDGVRPVLRQKIKSNQIGTFAFASRKAPARDEPGLKVNEERNLAPRGGCYGISIIRQLCFSAIACVEEFGFVAGKSR